MKEIPMIFQGWGVRAILEGRKTQTRRVLKPQPPCEGFEGPEVYVSTVVDRYGEEQPGPEVFGIYSEDWGMKLPAQPGDCIWVRETFKQLQYVDVTNLPEIDVMYADHDDYDIVESALGWKTVPSIHMPRWASRITLPLTGMRVERVQDISAEDCVAEGINREVTDMGTLYWFFKSSEWSKRPQDVFADVWDSINGKRPGYSWADNPWVVVYEWEKLKG